MRDGACVIRYDGKRGVVWRLKYRDADGRQVQETLGGSADGWSERKAKAELRARLTDVDRDGLRRVDPTLFEAFAREWDATYPDSKGLKRSTRAGYSMILRAAPDPRLRDVAAGENRRGARGAVRGCEAAGGSGAADDQPAPEPAAQGALAGVAAAADP